MSSSSYINRSQGKDNDPVLDMEAEYVSFDGSYFSDHRDHRGNIRVRSGGRNSSVDRKSSFPYFPGRLYCLVDQWQTCNTAGLTLVFNTKPVDPAKGTIAQLL